MPEEEYHSIKWLDENTATRCTKEVSLKCSITDNGTRIVISGTADLEHHLIEDSYIFLKKICADKIGEGHVQ